MLTIKHKDEEHRTNIRFDVFNLLQLWFFNQQNVFQIHGRPIGLCPRVTGEKVLPALFSKPMLAQCWTVTMLLRGAQYQPCVSLQADIAYPRQESPIKNGS